MIKRILLVEDEENLHEAIKLNLEIDNYSVTSVFNGKDVMHKFRQGRFDLIILDVMLPEVNGFDIAQTIRLENQITPILFLTAKSTPEDKITGLKLGDDYLTKPFDSEILLAKIKSILNRKPNVSTQETDTFEFEFGEFNFNSKLRILTHKDGDSYKLSPKENQLLKMLVLNFDDLLPRDIALNKIWRDANYFTSRSMDVYIAKLRKYLDKDVSLKIINVHGEGFRLMKE